MQVATRYIYQEDSARGIDSQIRLKGCFWLGCLLEVQFAGCVHLTLVVQVAARYIYQEDSARGIDSQIWLKGEIRAE